MYRHVIHGPLRPSTSRSGESSGPSNPGVPMAESNADKNAESTSSSPVAPDEIIKDLDVRVSDEETKDVKGGKENITFNFGSIQVKYGSERGGD